MSLIQSGRKDGTPSRGRRSRCTLAAERMAAPQSAMGSAVPHRVAHPPTAALNSPQWRQPKRIFVNSMSDLFHEKVRSNLS